MKRIAYIAAVLTGVLLGSSCNRIETDSNKVALHAAMKRVASKGSALDNSGIRDYDYDYPLEIALVRVDENSAGSSFPYFKDAGSPMTPITATMGTPDAAFRRDIEFHTAQYFRNETDNIRYASWYPANVGSSFSATAEKATVTFDIDGATDILYGSVTEGNKTDGFDDIVFNHALCQFNIYAYKMDYGTDDDDWGKLQRIIIKNIQKKLLLTLPNSSSDEYSFEFPSDLFDLALSDEGNGIFWAPGDEIPFGFDNKVRVATYLAPPPTKGYITMGITTEATTPFQQISIARNFQQGCSYDIVLRFTSHGVINAEISVGKWTYESPKGGEQIVHDVNADMYYDLSSYTPANCYIVPSGNYGYSFNGTVKGKSSIPLDHTPGFIDILWSDNPDIWDSSKAEEDNYLKLTTHSLSKERVMFKVGDIQDAVNKNLLHKGNVVIAAYDNATDRNILWTWHIWLNDSIGTIGYTNGYLALNHNLGASAPEEGGLYYQWGRKDPFAADHFRTESSPATIAQTVSHPTVYYGTGGSTWFNGNINQLREETFGASDLAVRSVYDPCPAGYFVPDHRMWNNDAISAFEDSYVTNDRVTLRFLNEDVVFPLSGGYLDASGTKRTDKPLFMWSTSLNKEEDAIYSFQYPSSKNSTSVAVSNMNFGGTIRCIAKAPDSEKNLSSSQTANSYIISKDGSYKFKANVAGNGVSSLITDKGNEWDMTGTKWGSEAISPTFSPDKIDYLWYQPALDTAIPSSVTTDDICVKILNDGKVDDAGYVHIEVEGWHPGNLILAAYDKRGIIQWSWHLWLTEKPEDMGNGNFALQDRNLGATRKGNPTVTSEQALATYGLYYQWGRKDPSPGAPSADYNVSDNASSAWFEYDRTGGSWSRRNTVKTYDGPISIKEAAQKPDCFILAKTMSDGDSKSPQRWHWMKGYYESILACKALWGYTIEDGDVGIFPTKTMYDPCPPGYTVAHHWVYWDTLTQTVNNSSDVTMKEDFVKKGDFGYACNRLSVGNYFPLSGRRTYQDGNIASASVSGYFWGSTPKSGGRTLTIGDEWGGMRLSKGKPDGLDNGSDQAYGQSVRCLKQ